MRFRIGLGLAGLGAAALGLAFLVTNQVTPEHMDGMGALAAYGSLGHDAMKVEPVQGVTSWTFGVPLCWDSAADPPVIESISPVHAFGSGFRLLGTGVRQFRVSQSIGPVISVFGWPLPDSRLPNGMQPVAGYEVTTSCAGGADGTDYTELLIGVGKAGEDGGGWQGIRIKYRAEGRTYTLIVDHDIEICGVSLSCQIPPD